MNEPRVVAAVDIGTNSARLLVVREDNRTITTLARELQIVRLGQDVDKTGRLHPDAIQRTVDAVTTFAEKWRLFGAEQVVISATSAVRDATNADEFVSVIGAVAGVKPTVLTGAEEAQLAFAGATYELPSTASDATISVVDIGGGSTEFITRRNGRRYEVSLQLGCVRVTERALVGAPPTSDHVVAAETMIIEALNHVNRLVDPTDAVTVVGVAGTVTTLAAIVPDLDLLEDGAVHHRTLTRDQIETVTERLLSLSTAQIAAIPAVQTGREDVITAGALILRAAARRFGWEQITVSETDLLDGLALNLLGLVPTEQPAQIAAEELVEIVDTNGNVVEVVPRAEVRARGARHRCTYIVVQRSDGNVVVHQRAAWKDIAPSHWDFAFGGLCEVGETWEDAAKRELEEEAGITDVELEDLGPVEWVGTNTSLMGRVYLAKTDAHIHPADGEVAVVDEVPRSELEQWITDHLVVADTPDVVLPLLP